MLCSQGLFDPVLFCPSHPHLRSGGFRRTGPPLCFLCGFATSLTVKGGSHPLSLAQRVKTTFAFVKGGFHPLNPAQSVETTFASVKGGFSPFEPGSKCQNLLSPHSPRASPALPRLRRFDPVHWVKPPSPRPSPGSSPVSPAPRPGFLRPSARRALTGSTPPEPVSRSFVSNANALVVHASTHSHTYTLTQCRTYKKLSPKR